MSGEVSSVTVVFHSDPCFFREESWKVGRTLLSYQKNLCPISFLSTGYMAIVQVLGSCPPTTLLIKWITNMYNSMKINEVMFEVYGT